MKIKPSGITAIFILILSVSCKKLVQIPPPSSTITTSQVFSSDNQANSAIAGIYSTMINGFNLSFGNGGITLFAGMSADEFIPTDQTAGDGYVQFQNNDLSSTNGNISSSLWSPAYSYIYEANAILEGLASSTSVHDSVKTELTGEAKFIRAFCYFYLVNLFGAVPLVTTTNYNETESLGKSSTTLIYQQIESDLKDAQSILVSDYSVGLGERIRPNKWAATALLARYYLYQQQWDSAITQAGSIIGNSQYSLDNSLLNVFLTNSTEAIWQLQQNNSSAPFNATQEGNTFIPFSYGGPVYPFVYFTNSFLNTFEVGDQRKAQWIDTITTAGVTYYYPYKYNIGPGQEAPNSPIAQYYMVLRLAEQYLIRAEAEAESGDLVDAIVDVNMIRFRAGLPGTTAASQPDILTAIYHERQVELFAEWGHRWLDLKRTGQAVSLLSAEKGFTVISSALLYPIPLTELQTDPNLTQNSGY